MLESGLFEVKTEKLLWAAASQVLDPDSVDAAIEDFTDVILNQLHLDGFIKSK